MDQVYDTAASTRLADFALSSKRPVEERLKAIEYLAEVDRKPAPWDGKWWGTQPAKGKPPARTIAWEGTPRVMTACRELATDTSVKVRTRAVQALAQIKDAASAAFSVACFRVKKTRASRRAWRSRSASWPTPKHSTF